MKAVAGFVLASAFALVPQTLASGVPVAALQNTVPAVQVGSTMAQLEASSAMYGPVLDLDAEAAKEDRFIRVGPMNRRVLIPKHRCRADAKHDVMLHFHGVPTSVEPSVERSGLDAVVVISTWGLGSGAYEDYFTPRGALSGMLDWVERTVNRECGVTTAGRDRLALSGWSAGYGAIYRILLHPEDRAQVDALLMSDGMHVGYVGPHKPNPESMQVYVDFAQEAIAGKKLFAITHSDIEPEKYASTRETAEFLVRSQNIALELVDEPGPRPKMHMTSRAKQGNFFVQGFEGKVARDHCQHLHALGDYLFPLLRDRWSGTPSSI
jgi:hypothetical protein